MNILSNLDFLKGKYFVYLCRGCVKTLQSYSVDQVVLFSCLNKQIFRGEKELVKESTGTCKTINK